MASRFSWLYTHALGRNRAQAGTRQSMFVAGTKQYFYEPLKIMYSPCRVKGHLTPLYNKVTALGA
jgi:hypothetical protein